MFKAIFREQGLNPSARLTLILDLTLKAATIAQSEKMRVYLT